jgi:hypothetical protein
MIPNVFVSSTIADLHYLRDGIRDAIEELSYHPVMSDHAEVGYVNPKTAAESCYDSIRQCQIAILIIGKRYGQPAQEDGYSVTHKEFLAARDGGIPIITFVEREVLSYRDVFNAQPDASIWDNFKAMDHPRKSFQLLDDVSKSNAFNGIIGFNSVGDAKKTLKFQIANLVGRMLRETGGSAGAQIKDLLAEISTVKSILLNSADANNDKELDAKRHHMATRFLLNDNASDYRIFLESVFGDIDSVIAQVAVSESFDDVINKSNSTIQVVDEEGDRKELFIRQFDLGDSPANRTLHGHYGTNGGYSIFADNHIKMSKQIFDDFCRLQRHLNDKIKLIS